METADALCICIILQADWLHDILKYGDDKTASLFGYVWLGKTQVKMLPRKFETRACQNASMQGAYENFIKFCNANKFTHTNKSLGLNVHGFLYFWRVKKIYKS